jgi:hypothetical protein
VVAFQAGSVRAVTTFEEADAALLSSSVAPQLSLCVLGAWQLAGSDEHGLGLKVLERGVRWPGLKASTERDLAWTDPEPRELGRPYLGTAQPLEGRATRSRGHDRPQRAGAVFSVTSASWVTNPNSVARPQRALAESSGAGIGLVGFWTKRREE